jgi:pyruvate,water dikinase
LPAGPAVAWLGEPACQDPVLAGGKTANLSRLAGKHRVPPGFCLTTAAFKAALAAGVTLDEQVERIPMLPAPIDAGLAAAYRALADRCGIPAPAVAVRSSAADEDGLGASFAGQHATYLNVAGADAVAEAVWRCWASARSARSLAYRRQQGLALDATGLAVLVQQLIVADASAIAFSTHPVTGRRDEVVINASWGLGESIVGGTVTPDTYRIRKADLTAAGWHVAEKGRMTVATTGGTREVDVPSFLRARPALTERQAAEIAGLALALEAEMGWPVDIECAYQDDILYLLQCRPITTPARRV